MADQVSGLTPGRALELGCGEGGDAIWLAGRGWQVTAVDISSIAVARGEQRAVAEGVDDRLRWIVADLHHWTPTGEYDLVTASFLQSPVDLDRADILRRCADQVVAGGRLVTVNHAAPPPWAKDHQHHHDALRTPSEEVAAIGLGEPGWEVESCETVEREAVSPQGDPTLLSDTMVVLRRH